MLAKLDYLHIGNTAAIRLIEGTSSHPGSEKERHKVTFMDGSVVLVDLSMDDADRLLGQIVLAPADYVVIAAHPPAEGGTTASFSTSPVLAIRASVDGCVPLTLAGEPRGTYALIYPSGRCEAPDLGHFDDAAEFKRAYQAFITGQIP